MSHLPSSHARSQVTRHPINKFKCIPIKTNTPVGFKPLRSTLEMLNITVVVDKVRIERADNDGVLAVTHYDTTVGGSTSIRQWAIAIDKEANKLRWQVGDKIDLEFTADGVLWASRLPEDTQDSDDEAGNH